MADEQTTLWHRLRRKIFPRLSLSVYGDREGICGADASVVWCGREWLYQNIEVRKQNA